jgi:hypothetical protein
MSTRPVEGPRFFSGLDLAQITLRCPSRPYPTFACVAVVIN